MPINTQRKGAPMNRLRLASILFAAALTGCVSPPRKLTVNDYAKITPPGLARPLAPRMFAQQASPPPIPVPVTPCLTNNCLHVEMVSHPLLGPAVRVWMRHNPAEVWSLDVAMNPRFTDYVTPSGYTDENGLLEWYQARFNPNNLTALRMYFYRGHRRLPLR